MLKCPVNNSFANPLLFWQKPGMKQAVHIPASISERNEYKRKFSFAETYQIFLRVPGAMAKLIRNKRTKLLSDQFVERLQLAVTEVNGCPACSYAHTLMALKQGMSNEEIDSFLSGDGRFVRPEEAKAILFAQHYADTGCRPEQAAYDAIVDEYGPEKAAVILAAVQVMTAGNAYGIPYSALHSRLKGKPYRDSTLAYELGMQVAMVLFVPVVLVHAGVRRLVG